MPLLMTRFKLGSFPGQGAKRLSRPLFFASSAPLAACWKLKRCSTTNPATLDLASLLPSRASASSSSSSSNSTSTSSNSVWLVSNDEMRDHHFRMPSNTVSKADVDSFQRWKERHQVTFTFGHWDRAVSRRPVLPRPPTPFSICMQPSFASSSSSASSSVAASTVNEEVDGGGGDHGSNTRNGAVAWHAPCLKEDPNNEKDFVGHSYSNAQGFAATSKPVDPEEFEWLCVFRDEGGQP
mmetsp:Transcript_64654/g.130022  ORF Transcript_64654/g.130022 Transcript_64654/m.130022 type:complete len:238 (+) Transcript_64654:179-892(+)